MFKFLFLALLVVVAYRLFVPSNRRIEAEEKAGQEPDEYIDYEEVE